ncbi:rhodanese-like domain-containing protein [Halalkalibaculum sp. DA3122]|uniref:rhodanese-like domain-containing protein n=1 Tax=Halalkalibaculum sp. DA3122 TaxID=3373607 RepID=UPI00375429DD
MPVTYTQRYKALINDALKRVVEVTPDQVWEMLEAGSDIELVDVREKDEWYKVRIAGARHLCKGIIEREIERVISDPKQEIILYCVRGYRSVLVADNLQKMGYRSIRSMKGGLHSWIEAGLPVEY